MNDKEKADFKELINRKMVFSRNKIDRYRDMAAPVSPENAIGRVSRMDAINNKSIAEAALREEEEKLRGLEYMLHHLDREDFGQCILCGQPIPTARLLLMPHSPHCIRCAR